MNKQELRMMSTNDLKGLLSGADLLESVEVFEEIRSRLDSLDPDLLVALSVRLFVLGEDSKAANYLKVALEMQPENVNALKFQVFLAAANGSRNALTLCRDLLERCPADNWVTEICRKVDKADSSSLRLPPLHSYWENLATGAAGRS
ncbi:hypothetical protein [Arenimonas sp. MALMAid1274]|uniref:hypothetical protein n=1 Tax=Arenimonas sp. MALMAid1274 TaxID=3411630 RepID=UPI003BA16CBB